MRIGNLLSPKSPKRCRPAISPAMNCSTYSAAQPTTVTTSSPVFVSAFSELSNSKAWPPFRDGCACGLGMMEIVKATPTPEGDEVTGTFPEWLLKAES